MNASVLLIGIERGWKERAAEEGARIAGPRIFGLIGLLGGASRLLAIRFGPLPMSLVFLDLAPALALDLACLLEIPDSAPRPGD